MVETDTTIGMAFRRCGNCAHAASVPNDLQARTCKAGWPTCVALPAKGGLQIRSIWPMVGINDQCGQWMAKPGAAAAFASEGIAGVVSGHE